MKRKTQLGVQTVQKAQAAQTRKTEWIHASDSAAVMTSGGILALGGIPASGGFFASGWILASHGTKS